MSASEPAQSFPEELKKLFENSQPTQDEEPRVWIKLVRDKLFNMFCSPMKEDFANEAYKWVAHLCLSIGDLSWLSVEDKNWTKHEAKMFTCIASLSMSEIKILLPLITRHLTCGDAPEIEDNKLVARSANSSDYDLFGNHLIIFESVIKTLIVDQDTDDQKELDVTPLSDIIENPILNNLLNQLKDAVNEICDYLELVHRHWQELVEDTRSEKFISAEAALRLMCVWLSEEPTGFESQCNRFLIDLITKRLLLQGGQTNNDLYVIALHSLCVQNGGLLKALKNTPNHDKAFEIYLEHIEHERRKQKKGDKKEAKAKRNFRLRYGLVDDLRDLLKNK